MTLVKCFIKQDNEHQIEFNTNPTYSIVRDFSELEKGILKIKWYVPNSVLDYFKKCYEYEVYDGNIQEIKLSENLHYDDSIAQISVKPIMLEKEVKETIPYLLVEIFQELNSEEKNYGNSQTRHQS